MEVSDEIHQGLPKRVFTLDLTAYWLTRIRTVAEDALEGELDMIRDSAMKWYDDNNSPTGDDSDPTNV